MSETAEKVAEEVVEEAVEATEQVVEVVRNNPVVLAVVGVLGLAAGAAGGYFVAKKRLREFYEDLAAEEIAQAKEFYAGLNKVTVDGEPLTPQEILEQKDPEALEALRRYRGEQAAKQIEEAGELETALDEQDEAQVARIEERMREERQEERAEETHNVFVDPTFDLQEELKHRTKDSAYVISHDEYFAAEKDYDTQQLVYYEKDDTLVGEDDKPVSDLTIINEDNLARFGHGSRDKNIVYVRNEKLETDYEITLSDQSYLEAIGLGPEPGELTHSDRAARRAFRNGDG